MEYCFIIGGFVFILLVVVVVLLVYLLASAFAFAFAFAFALCSCSCSCRPPSMCCLRRCVQVLFVFCGVMFHVVHVVVVMHVHVHLGCVFIQGSASLPPRPSAQPYPDRIYRG